VVEVPLTGGTHDRANPCPPVSCLNGSGRQHNMVAIRPEPLHRRRDLADTAALAAGMRRLVS
jgi:hypothetical protein